MFLVSFSLAEFYFDTGDQSDEEEMELLETKQLQNNFPESFLLKSLGSLLR